MNRECRRNASSYPLQPEQVRRRLARLFWFADAPQGNTHKALPQSPSEVKLSIPALGRREGSYIIDLLNTNLPNLMVINELSGVKPGECSPARE